MPENTEFNPEVMTLLKKAKTLNNEEAKQLHNALTGVNGSGVDSAMTAVLTSEHAETARAAFEAAMDAVHDAELDRFDVEASLVAGNAAMGFTVQDLVPEKISKDHYRALTGPWKEVFGCNTDTSTSGSPADNGGST